MALFRGFAAGRTRRLGSVALGLVALGLVALVAAPAVAPAQEGLPKLAQVGPWPVVSRLVGYEGRLWFANSVKGRNHNSADVYSFDPETGALRYERHLFSQDAGRPLVADGLLYWPYEDGRISLGWGGFMVTDGERWRAGTVASAEIFHVFAMALLGDRLVAATSAWRAGLQVSEDNGRSWRSAYDHPTPDRRVSRITDLIEVNGRLLGSLTSRDRQGVLRFDGETVAELAGWPRDVAVSGWARFGDWVYALVPDEDGTALWRSDGTKIEKVAPSRAGWRPRALAAGARALWAVTGDGNGGGGVLWRSADGRGWERYRAIPEGRPWEVAVADGWLFVGGTGDDGAGALWGLPLAAEPPTEAASAGRLETGLADGAPVPSDAVAARLDQALGAPGSYQQHAARLRDLVFDLALHRPSAEVWRQRLARPVPDTTLSLIGGNTSADAGALARWVLLWGMSLAGTGEVPLDWLREPWTTPDNPAEKYFATAPAAIWTAGEIGQDDRATLDALVARLDRQDDPLWLTGDVVGALTALTGRRFAYDRAAWRAWWESAKADWPH